MMMEAALGVDTAPLLAMQNEYDMLMAERNESFMEKLNQIRRIAAVLWGTQYNLEINMHNVNNSAH